MSSSGLFKKFTIDSIAQMASTKTSEQRRVRQRLQEQYPMLEPYWEEIMPKKDDIMLVRAHDQVHLVTTVGAAPRVLFFNHHDGDFLPHLRLLHQYPFILPRHQVDVGGCKYVISGANVMCQGLTSAGGEVADDVNETQPVAIYIEGKEHAVAVGFATMSSDEILKKNKGPCVDNVHYLGDGLWMTPVLASGAAKTQAQSS